MRAPLVLTGAVAACVLALTASGCSSATSSASVPATSASASVAGQPLSAYGLSNGPAGFRLPDGLVVEQRIDQPNVVTLFFTADAGPQLAAWLAKNLPALGYHVDAAKNGSVVFSGPTWGGAFTSDSQVSAFTLRRN